MNSDLPAVFAKLQRLTFVAGLIGCAASAAGLLLTPGNSFW